MTEDTNLTNCIREEVEREQRDWKHPSLDDHLEMITLPALFGRPQRTKNQHKPFEYQKHACASGVSGMHGKGSFHRHEG